MIKQEQQEPPSALHAVPMPVAEQEQVAIGGSSQDPSESDEQLSNITWPAYPIVRALLKNAAPPGYTKPPAVEFVRVTNSWTPTAEQQEAALRIATGAGATEVPVISSSDDSSDDSSDGSSDSSSDGDDGPATPIDDADDAVLEVGQWIRKSKARDMDGEAARRYGQTLAAARRRDVWGCSTPSPLAWGTVSDSSSDSSDDESATTLILPGDPRSSHDQNKPIDDEVPTILDEIHDQNKPLEEVSILDEVQDQNKPLDEVLIPDEVQDQNKPIDARPAIPDRKGGHLKPPRRLPPALTKSKLDAISEALVQAGAVAKGTATIAAPSNSEENEDEGAKPEKTKKTSDYNKFMSEWLKDKSNAAGDDHKERFKKCVAAWNTTKPVSHKRGDKRKSAVVEIVEEGSAAELAAEVEPAAESPSVVTALLVSRVSFGCPKCRHGPTGCCLCNPDKKARLEAKKASMKKVRC
jgi:hypothetical protein